MSPVVAVALVIRLVGEAGLFELGVLAAGIAAGAILGVLLGGVPRLGCSLGMRSDKHRVLGPVTIGNVGGVRGLVCLGADPGTFTGKLIIGKLSEFIGVCPINSDKFIGSDKITR